LLQGITTSHTRTSITRLHLPAWEKTLPMARRRLSLASRRCPRQPLPRNRISKVKLDDFKAVFFDFGDTLAVLSPSREELFVQAARATGLELEPEPVRRAYATVDFHTKYSSVHLTNRDDFYHNYNQQLCEALGISSYFERLNPVLVAHFQQNKRWVLFDGAAATLQRLRGRGISLALVANWDSDLGALTAQMGIRELFSTIVPSQDAGVEKPDPAIFRRAAENLSLNLDMDRVLYVGNEYRADVLGARHAGLTPVLIDRNQLYKHADCLSFPSLGQWLDAMW
jgi:putative hydrolase of the HAD superfamily